MIGQEFLRWSLGVEMVDCMVKPNTQIQQLMLAKLLISKRAILNNKNERKSLQSLQKKTDILLTKSRKSIHPSRNRLSS